MDGWKRGLRWVEDGDGDLRSCLGDNVQLIGNGAEVDLRGYVGLVVGLRRWSACNLGD